MYPSITFISCLFSSKTFCIELPPQYFSDSSYDILISIHRVTPCNLRYKSYLIQPFKISSTFRLFNLRPPMRPIRNHSLYLRNMILTNQGQSRVRQRLRHQTRLHLRSSQTTNDPMCSRQWFRLVRPIVCRLP